jgi:hypothetical protein
MAKSKTDRELKGNEMLEKPQHVRNPPGDIYFFVPIQA